MPTIARGIWRGALDDAGAQAAGRAQPLDEVGRDRGDDPERHQQAERGDDADAALHQADEQRRRRPRSRPPTCSARARSGSSASFQRASGPMPIRNTSGAISGTNTVSK